ncbi:LAMI_0H00716g1_1 [Lachancea mirantina]|uniref:Serine/threonine-protein phosphatase 2A activator n=1 Tax=Lachancea mirantina TaxID=1230905 RepID=A0A1G4KDI3_9SACH|nr:LAMI_0H00716g1_1 [Lachancea mirantina]
MNSTNTSATLDASKCHFVEPVKRIFDSEGVQEFQHSAAMQRLQQYLAKYVRLVNGVDIPDGSNNGVVNRFVEILLNLSIKIDEVPPLPGPRRYGNMACRDWHDKVRDSLDGMLLQFVGQEFESCVVELRYYVLNSLGSQERLDYGTGHELSFLAAVAAIDMLGIWGQHFSGQDVLFIFNAYYVLIRKLIATYTLEPAGSHGVWGLDDHFHFIYILGSSQWANNKRAPMMPQDVTDKSIVEEYASVNFYCQAVNFVYTVKSGPFAEHSPMLYDISKTVSSWSKALKGLQKMYSVEVLKKFPVVQHFWFGDGFFPWVSASDGSRLAVFEPPPETGGVAARRTFNSNGSLSTVYSHAMAPPVSRNVSRFIAPDRFRRPQSH